MLNKIAIVILVLVLAWGLEQVVVSPIETGAAYPEYSSLRADPMGGMALYESLQEVVKVERLFKNRTQSDPGKGTTILVLGVDPVSWSSLDDKTFDEYDKLVSKGARLVFAFTPANKFLDSKKSKEKSALQEHWDIRFTYAKTHAEIGQIPYVSGLKFDAGKEWKLLDEATDAIERRVGAGSVALIADSYPLSNEGLRDARNPQLIVALAGDAREVIFDENHFGVSETGSIAALMRKYHLEGALGILALVAALFLWRSSSSLLPSRAPAVGQAVTGRDSLEGMTSLLRRCIAEQDLIRTCYEEWRKTSLNDDKNISLDEASLQNKNAVAAYKAVMEKL